MRLWICKRKTRGGFATPFDSVLTQLPSQWWWLMGLQRWKRCFIIRQEKLKWQDGQKWMMHHQMPCAYYRMDIKKSNVVCWETGSKKEGTTAGRRSAVGTSYNPQNQDGKSKKRQEELLMKGRVRCVVLVTLTVRELLFCYARVQPPANRDPRSLVLSPVMIPSFKVDQSALLWRHL